MEPANVPRELRLAGGARLWPAVRELEREGDACRFELLVPAELACWPGHFPGWPVVPGVLQLHWVLALAAGWLGAPLRLVRIEASKFTAPIGPGQRLELRVERAARGRLRFSFSDEARVFSSGRLEVSADAGEARA